MDTQLASALNQAVVTFIARRDRRAHPHGTSDRGGRWFPSSAEEQACCGRIRYPSRAWPYSLLVHCRTAEHIALMFGVDVRDVRRGARAADKATLAAA